MVISQGRRTYAMMSRRPYRCRVPGFTWTCSRAIRHNRISIDHRTTGGDQMTKILEGVRILEVAEHTFVPAASAALADLGAEVIKIEHVSRGDAMRGLASTGVATMADDVHGLLEHSKRG